MSGHDQTKVPEEPKQQGTPTPEVTPTLESTPKPGVTPIATPPAQNNFGQRANNSETQSNQVMNDLSVTLRGLNTRQLPTWDHNAKKRESIKEHLQMAKQLGRRLEWSDKELANEVMLSLRGESRTAARNFPENIQNSFELLEKELEKYFWVPKPKSQMMKEFNNLSWNPEKQTLLQYGVTLRSKLMKIFRGDTEEFNLKLRDRFIEGIKEMRPEFGRSFEMLDLDSKSDFMELATYAQMKYDIYRINSERIEEDQAFITKEYNNEKKKNKTNGTNQPEKQGWHQNNPRGHDNQQNGSIDHQRVFQEQNWQASRPQREYYGYPQGPRPRNNFGPPNQRFQNDFQYQKPVNWHFRNQHWGRRPDQFGFNDWKDQRYNARFNQFRGQGYDDKWRNNYNWGDERTMQYPYFNPGFQADRFRGQNQQRFRRNQEFNKYDNRYNDRQTPKGTTVRKHESIEYLEPQKESKNL